MKRIYLDIVGDTHSLYHELTECPPDGYEFVSSAIEDDRERYLAGNERLRALQRGIVKTAVPLNLLRAYMQRNKTLPPDIDLTYSSGHIIFRDEPWIADCEYITHFAGYDYGLYLRYRRIIERKLADSMCKKIIPWTIEGEKTVRMAAADPRIAEKVETVHLAVRPKDFQKEHDESRVRLLFVGSANIPLDFDIKGGKEVLEAFAQLSGQYEDLELVVRSYVPPRVKEQYKGQERLRIIDEIIPWAALEEEFLAADIFLFPSYSTPGLAILDAMSYELPVIATDVWANPEMVADHQTGLLIRQSGRIDAVGEHNVPAWHSRASMRVINNGPDPDVVAELVEKTSLLIEDSQLRRRLGRDARHEIAEGEFSVRQRNARLRRIFEEAAGR